MCVCVPHHSPSMRRTLPQVRLEILKSSMLTNQVLGVNQQLLLFSNLNSSKHEIQIMPVFKLLMRSTK